MDAHICKTVHCGFNQKVEQSGIPVMLCDCILSVIGLWIVSSMAFPQTSLTMEGP